MKILFIGNSYTYFNDLPALFRKLAADNGHSVDVFSVTQGGRKLIAFQNPDDPYTEQLNALLAEHEFDIVFVQEYSTLPYLDYDTFYSGAAHIVETVRPHSKRIIFYATWGRKPGCPLLAERGWTHDSMTKGLADAYTRAAQALDAEVSYAGLKFQKILQTHPEIELYNEDGSHPSYAGSCLAAMTHYRTAFGSPVNNYTGFAMESKVLDILREATAD